MQDVHPIGTTPTGGFADRRLRPHSHHHQGVLKCPRCESLNTKFCYYNNYNLSQPRHFCKNCRRYWTKGGVLRNVPVGGGCRKTKRSSKNKLKQQQHSSSPTSTLVAGKATTNSTLTSLSSSEGSTSGNQFGGSTFPIPDSENFEVPVLGSGNSDNNNNNSNISCMNYHHEYNGNNNNQNSIGDMYNIGGFCNSIMGGTNSTSPSASTDQDMNIPLATTASFSEFLQGGHHHQQMLAADSNWELKDSSGAQRMLDHEIENFLQNSRESSASGLNLMDWHHGQGLFDLPSSTHVDDDHQEAAAAFWSQTTSSQDHHQHQWSDNNGSHHSLFLP